MSLSPQLVLILAYEAIIVICVSLFWRFIIWNQQESRISGLTWIGLVSATSGDRSYFVHFRLSLLTVY